MWAARLESAQLMTRDEMNAYAAAWIAAWNHRDVERVLGLFSDDIAFTSPTALALLGPPTVRGKAALRAYWVHALTRIGLLRFTLERVLWDPATRELAIL